MWSSETVRSSPALLQLRPVTMSPCLASPGSQPRTARCIGGCAAARRDRRTHAARTGPVGTLGSFRGGRPPRQNARQTHKSRWPPRGFLHSSVDAYLHCYPLGCVVATVSVSQHITLDIVPNTSFLLNLLREPMATEHRKPSTLREFQRRRRDPQPARPAQLHPNFRLAAESRQEERLRRRGLDSYKFFRLQLKRVVFLFFFRRFFITFT